MLYTSYFAKVRTFPPNLTPIGISLWPPRWFNGESYRRLAPGRALLTRTKVGEYTHDDYRRIYAEETLGPLDPMAVYQDLCDKGANVALCCYERPGEFCHRRLVAAWLEGAIGITVPEYDPAIHNDRPTTNTT